MHNKFTADSLSTVLNMVSRSSDNKYVAWAGYPNDVNVYLKHQVSPVWDSPIAYIRLVPSPINGDFVRVWMEEDRRKVKKFKYVDYVFVLDMAEAIDSWIKYKPRNTKRRKSKFQKWIVLNSNFLDRIMILP